MASNTTSSDPTVQATSSEAHPNEQTSKIAANEPTIKLRSGRIVQKKWLTAQANNIRDKNNVGNSIRLEIPKPPPEAHPKDQTSDDVSNGSSSSSPPPNEPPKPMSDVFNIPELLEPILLNLETAFILHTAQRVCRGFKQSIALSPALRKRRELAIQIDFDINDSAVPKLRGRAKCNSTSFYVNLRPSCFSLLSDSPQRSSVNLRFGESTKPSFRSVAALQGLRSVRVFDKAPPSMHVITHLTRTTASSCLNRLVGKLFLTGRECEDVTFGQLFDAVAARNNADRVHSLWIIWYRHGRE